MSELYAVVRVRGTVGVRKEIADTLKSLRLTKPNHCVMIPVNEYSKGMLQKAKDYVTWGEVSDELLELMISKRGKVSSSKAIDQKDVASAVKKFKEGKQKETDMKTVFMLSPPRKGYESGGVKRTFNQKGALGYRADKINDLLKKMI